MTNNIERRIIKNIYLEALKLVLEGVPMSKRGTRWDSAVAEAIEKAKVEALHRIISDEKRTAKKAGLTHETWLERAKSYYVITDDYTVISMARSKNKTRSYEFQYEYEARAKVLELIKFKHYDHFVKGHDFRW